jgi:dienelactone hydrolase
MSHTKASVWSQTPDLRVYARCLHEIDRLLSAEEHQGALDLLEATWPGLPDVAPDVRLIEILLFKAYLRAQLGRPGEALGVFQSLVRCGLASSLASPAYAAVRDLPEYAEFARANDRALERAQRDAKVELDVHVPDGLPGGAKAAAFLILHGEPGNLVRARDEWPPQAVTARGVIAAYVQSSQLRSAGRYLWGWGGADPARAQDDIRAAFDRLCCEAPVDAGRIVLGGFSGGATAALDAVFRETVPAAGFVCLCAGDRVDGLTSQSLARAKARGVRGVLLEGEENWPDEEEQASLDAMRAAGLAVELVLNPGVGHGVPEDFPAKIGRALDFVLLGAHA